MKYLLISFCFLSAVFCVAQTVIVEDSNFYIQSANQEKSQLKWTKSGYVYSLPVKDDFVIHSNKQDVFKLIVFNSFGEKMIYREEQTGAISVDVSKLSQGTYYLVLTGDKYSQSFKFTKV